MHITIQVRGHFSLFLPVLANVWESETLIKSTASAAVPGTKPGPRMADFSDRILGLLFQVQEALKRDE